MFTQLLMGWEMRGVAKSYEVIMAWGQVKSERERISVSSWKVGNFFWLESLLQVLPRSRCCLHFYNITRNKSSTRQARIWKTNISVIMITIPIWIYCCDAEEIANDGNSNPILFALEHRSKSKNKKLGLTPTHTSARLFDGIFPSEAHLTRRKVLPGQCLSSTKGGKSRRLLFFYSRLSSSHEALLLF